MRRIKRNLRVLILLIALFTPMVSPIFNEPYKIEASSIKISSSKLTVEVGKTHKLTMKGTKKSVTWSTSNKKVAVVSKKGTVTGKKVGTATIKAKVGSKTYSCKVTVKAAVKLKKTSALLNKGKTTTLSMQGTKSKVTWSSSNKSVATVNKSGKITAKKAGKAVISAKVNKKTYRCNVTVEDPKISKTSLKLAVGKTATLKLTGTKRTITWSTSNKSIATVNSKGQVTGKKAGKVTIKAKVNNSEFSCLVTVEKGMTKYPENNYKVGVDIPAGEYVVFANGGYGYVCVSTDPDGDDIIDNENFTYNVIIKVSNGDYLELSNSYAVPIDEAKVDITKSGMFKVGLHIKPGDYVIEGRSAYYERNQDAIGGYSDIIANDNFNGKKYIRVNEDEYLYLSRCTGKFEAPSAQEVQDYLNGVTNNPLKDLSKMTLQQEIAARGVILIENLLKYPSSMQINAIYNRVGEDIVFIDYSAYNSYGVRVNSYAMLSPRTTTMPGLYNVALEQNKNTIPYFCLSTFSTTPDVPNKESLDIELIQKLREKIGTIEYYGPQY